MTLLSLKTLRVSERTKTLMNENQVRGCLKGAVGISTNNWATGMMSREKGRNGVRSKRQEFEKGMEVSI